MGTTRDTAKEKTRGLTAFSIKIIAITTMLTDHIGAVIIQPYLNAKMDSLGYDLSQTLNTVYNITRAIGRMAFPLFCFMLVEGFFHTRNKWKYLLRLLIFAIISEIPYNLALAKSTFSLEKQSVLVTLSLGLLMLILLDFIRKTELSEFIKGLLTLIVIAAFCMVAHYVKCDYELKGILMIAGIYLLYPMFSINRFTFCACTGLMYFWEWSKTLYYFPASLSPMLLCFYNGKKGRSLKYFFYLFYPVHLLILYFISRYLINYH